MTVQAYLMSQQYEPAQEGEFQGWAAHALMAKEETIQMQARFWKRSQCDFRVKLENGHVVRHISER